MMTAMGGAGLMRGWLDGVSGMVISGSGLAAEYPTSFVRK
jgi:hypothetical protein